MDVRTSNLSDVLELWYTNIPETPSYYPLMILVFLFLLPFVMEAYEQKFGGSSMKDEGSKKEFDQAEHSNEKEGTELETSKKEIIKLDKEDTKRPSVAWPTVLLGLTSFGAWVMSMFLYSSGNLSAIYAFSMSTVCTYICFTPLHDSVHSAVSWKYKWLNNLIGRICGIPLFAPMPLFKFVHLCHHRYLNDSENGPEGSSLDPDKWGGEGNVYLLPLRWSTIFVSYVVFTRKMLRFRREDASRSETAKRNDETLKNQLISGFGTLGAIAVLLWRFCGDALLVCWIAPAMTAMIFLVYAFDYLPHRPHLIPFSEDPYTSTSATIGPFGLSLTIPLLSQNNHQVHHAYPFLPFYRYSAIWNKYGNEFIKRGTRELPVILFPGREKWLQELNESTRIGSEKEISTLQEKKLQ